MDKSIRKKVDDFLNDPSRKKVEIKVPKDFRVGSLVNPFALAYRKAVLFVQKWIIPCGFKDWLLRTTGMRIGREVCVPHYITFDPYFPQLITVGDGTIIGGLCTLLAHEVKGSKLVLGRIDVAPRVLLAGMTTIHPGVTIHEKCITGMRSDITKDVPPDSFAVGNDRIVKQWSPEEIERHFGESKREKGYRKSFLKKAREFRKDGTMRRITIRYEGTRMNPGNEWYLARPWPRIYYNAVFVELARIAPGNWLRKLLWRCMGTKIGRDVRIGRNMVIDHIYGDKAIIEDDVRIGDGGYIDGHSYTITESDFGRTRVCKGARIGDDVHLFCGVTVGEGATVRGPASVMRDIPPGETWAGMPAKKVE